MGAAKTTIDHEEIRRWVEQHGGHPATVRRTRSNGNVGMIRVDFPGFSGEDSLEPIEWDEWFQNFDEQKLAFLYQQGKNTNFNKLVRRDPDEVRPSDRRRGPSRTTRGGRAAARALATEGQSKGRSNTNSRGRSDRAPTRGTNSEGAGTRGTRSKSARTRKGRAEGTRTERTRSQGANTRGARAASSGTRATRSESSRTRGARSEGRRSADLASQTKADLYQRARKAGIERSSSMNKPQLIRALERLRAPAR